MGIILRNVPVINVAKEIDPDWSFTLRQMALGVILGEAGVEVDKEVSIWKFRLLSILRRLWSD